MDITKYAILKKLAGGGGGSGDHADEDAIVSGTITEYTNDRVTRIGANVFSESKLVSISLPKVTSISRRAFYYSDKLVSINAPLVETISSSVFSSCYRLTSVNFPLLRNAQSGAFSTCKSLTSVCFPLLELESGVSNTLFSGCTNLITADLPLTLIIAGQCFFGCTALASLILRNTTQVCTLSSTNAFNNTPIASGTGYIYVPAALIDSYKTATNWTTYANQFRALESYTVDGTTTGELDPTKVNA